MWCVSYEKPLLVRICVAVRVLHSVFAIFVLRRLVIASVRNTKKLPITVSTGPDKKESNNGYEHVGMQKGANFTTVCTILLIDLNSKS